MNQHLLNSKYWEGLCQRHNFKVLGALCHALMHPWSAMQLESSSGLRGWKIGSILFWVHFLGGVESKCFDACEAATGFLSPSCSVKVDGTGRFHFAFSNRCPAAMAVEASICANLSTLGAAFLLYDVALMNVASLGGATCFDNSDWCTVFNTSSQQLLSSYIQVIEDICGPGCRLPKTNKPQTTCPVTTGLRNWAQLPALAITQLMAWNQEVWNVNEPYWNDLGLQTMPLPLVSCLVPIVWPSQKHFLHAIVNTFGQDCDELFFFVSSASSATDLEMDIDMMAEGQHKRVSLINLHELYPIVPPDQDVFHRETGDRPGHDSFNTIIKLLHMLRWAAENTPEAGQWWHCRLERDTFFIPENFRFLVASERLDASQPHYLGVRQFIDLPRMGLVFNDGGPGVCLSRSALSRLHQLLRAMPPVVFENPDFQQCVLATGHREDLMLAACLRQMNIYPSPVTTDKLGREWFSIRPVSGIPTHYPPAHTRIADGQPAWNFWTGRSHLFLPCAQHNAQWIVETPVSFNSFKNTSMFYETWAFMKLPSHERFHEIGFRLELSGLHREKLERRKEMTRAPNCFFCKSLWRVCSLWPQLLNLFTPKLSRHVWR